MRLLPNLEFLHEGAIGWESAVIGRHAPVEDDIAEAIENVKQAAAGIRARRFDATPSYNACRYCAYNQICPFTATSE